MIVKVNLISTLIQANEDKDCSICLEEMRDYNSRRLHCGHKFHKACMDVRYNYYIQYISPLKMTRSYM